MSIALDILKSLPRKATKKTCKYGGRPWIPENIYHHRSGNACKLCKAAREKTYRAARKAVA